MRVFAFWVMTEHALVGLSGIRLNSGEGNLHERLGDTLGGYATLPRDTGHGHREFYGDWVCRWELVCVLACWKEVRLLSVSIAI